MWLKLIFNTSISNYLKKRLLKFFRQNNYTEKAKILYFLNLVYFLSLAYDKIMCFIDLWPTLCDVIGRHLEKGSKQKRGNVPTKSWRGKSRCFPYV
jgi:hypothetical protein